MQTRRTPEQQQRYRRAYLAAYMKAYRGTQDTEAPRQGKEKAERVNLGLELARSVSSPGQCWTRREIAAFCGCTDATIETIERRALRKLARLLMDQGLYWELKRDAGRL